MGQIECPSCGRSISSDSTSCKYCGEPVKSAQVVESTLSNTVACPGCGQSIKAGLEACPHCGFERKVAKKKTPPKTKPEKAPPQVIVPRKKAVVEEPPVAHAAPPPAVEAAPPREVKPAEPRVAPPAKSEPAASTREPRTRTPEPPTKIDQERIDATRNASTPTELPPPPPGLDSDYLPERPEGLISGKIHVFLRGLQLAVKPMDYPALITNIRSHKVKLNDFIFDEARKGWRTIADMFNLPEME